MTKTFTLRFVPHLPPVEFRVAALNAVAAKREAETQIRTGEAPRGRLQSVLLLSP